MGTKGRGRSGIFLECRWWNMRKSSIRVLLAGIAALAILSLTVPLRTQSSQGQTSPPPAGNPNQDQNIPDAPSAVQPPKPAQEAPLPDNPATQPQQPPAEGPSQQAPNRPTPNQPPPSQEGSPETPPSDEGKPPERPPINIRTVPEGGATKDSEGFYKLPPFQVNQVMVPVTVKDDSGRLVTE